MAVALAAVVAVPPAFAQVSEAQGPPGPVSVLPFGEELPDEALSEAEGAVNPMVPYFIAAGVIGVLVGVRSCTRHKFSDIENAILDGITAALSYAVGVVADRWSSCLSSFTFIDSDYWFIDFCWLGGGGWVEPEIY